MKILLVYPRYPDTFWGFRTVLKFVKAKASQPPLGLLIVASIIRLFHSDWEIRLVDENVSPLTEKDLPWADIVMISAMAIQSKRAQEIIDLAKQFEKIVVAGGPVFTASYDGFTGVDYFVLNDAEITLKLFFEDWDKNNTKHIYTSEIRVDLDYSPLPMWSLISFSDYAAIGVQYSSGCPYDCDYCDITVLYGRKPRTKSPKRLINEIQSLYDAGYRHGPIFFVDDNIVGNKPRLKLALPEVIKWQRSHKYPYTITFQASVDLADHPDLLELMSQANMCSAFIGFETTHLPSLESCNKKQNKRDLEKVAFILQQHGIQPMGAIMVGFDPDPKEIFDQLINFLQKTGIPNAMVSLLDAMRGTKFYQRLKAEDRLLSESQGDNTGGFLNFRPKMPIPDLLKGYQHILSTIYSPYKYYRRVSRMITNIRPTVKSKLTRNKFQAFLKSIWYVGITSRFWFWYWLLLIRTLIIKVRVLPLAVEYSIYWLHFKEVTRNTCKRIQQSLDGIEAKSIS
ncbi:MAG: B12-binding domain-containing radical SAM protein [Patescibacteria group bacterium]